MGDGVEIRIAAEAADEGRRADVVLAERAEDLSRSRAAVLLEHGHVRLDGRVVKPSHRLRGGEIFEGVVPASAPSTVEAQPISLDILYEDADLVAVNKPPGMVVHPAAGNPDGTLVNALLAHSRDLSGVGGVMRPGIVHRLDKGTSGVILCAKNDVAHEALSRQFSGRTIEKVYLAVTLGAPSPAKGRIERPIGRHPTERKKMAVDAPRARSAITEYAVLGAAHGLAAVRCRLLTGRTHQIRVHLQSLGCPLLMDATYGGGSARGLDFAALAVRAQLDRPALHAWRVEFDHPRSKTRITLVAPIPADLGAALRVIGVQP